MDNTKPDVDIREHVLQLAWDPIYDKLFAGIYPSIASWLSATLESVKQDHMDTTGNTVSSTVQVYYIEIIKACCAMHDTFGYCAVTHFTSNPPA